MGISVGTGDNPKIEFTVIGVEEEDVKAMESSIKAIGSVEGKAKLTTNLGTVLQLPKVESKVTLTGIKEGELDETSAKALMAKQLGVDPSKVRIINVGTGDNPKIEFEVLDLSAEEKETMSTKITQISSTEGKAAMQKNLGELSPPVTTTLGTIAKPVSQPIKAAVVLGNIAQPIASASAPVVLGAIEEPVPKKKDSMAAPKPKTSGISIPGNSAKTDVVVIGKGASIDQGIEQLLEKSKMRSS